MASHPVIATPFESPDTNSTLAREYRNRSAIARFRLAQDAPEQAGRRIRQQIVIDYISLAESVAHRFSSRSQDWYDIRQVAYLGLVKAVDRFDPGRGDDFASFAVPTIAGEIKRHLRDTSWSVRPPRHVQELHNVVVNEIPRITQELQHSPSEQDIADDLGVTAERVAEALNCSHGRWPVSLDATVQDDETVTLADTVGSTDTRLEHADLCQALRSAYLTLTPRERLIVYLRFFLEQTQAEIARELGVTQMQVSRLLTKILGVLRSHLSPDLLVA